MPIYEVTTPKGTKLVEASTKAAAIKHVITPGVSAKVLKPTELHKLLKAGHEVEEAIAEDEKADTESKDESAE